MSSIARASKYSYRASSGGIADVNIEYSADLTALTRLEVKKQLSNYSIDRIYIYPTKKKNREKIEWCGKNDKLEIYIDQRSYLKYDALATIRIPSTNLNFGFFVYLQGPPPPPIQLFTRQIIMDSYSVTKFIK